MPLTLDEIVANQDRVRREIVERECFLAALDVLHKHVASGRGPQLPELGSLVPAFTPSASPVSWEERPALPPPTPPALPPVPRYVHPELLAMGTHRPNHTLSVRWAVGKMEGDYSLHDLAELLEREGKPLGAPEISVVLTRLKRLGEIEEIKRSAGPHPAVFRKPVDAIPPEPAFEDAIGDAKAETLSLAAS